MLWSHATAAVRNTIQRVISTFQQIRQSAPGREFQRGTNAIEKTVSSVVDNQECNTDSTSNVAKAAVCPRSVLMFLQSCLAGRKDHTMLMDSKAITKANTVCKR